MTIKLTDTDSIRESKKGVSYAPPQRLGTKKTVFSQAILQKIPHATQGKVDICLKIGRYKLNEQVETAIPKSELTLEYSELSNLITYIEKYYKRLELDAANYIPLNSTDSAQLLLKFKSLVGSNEALANQLLDSGILSDEISSTIDFIKRKKAVREFEKTIDEEYPESFWQKWFNSNKWILGSEYLKILSERHIDTKNIADYLVQAFDGFLDIVEIKKPNGLNFWMSSTDHNNYVPSSDLIKAITQCQNYIYEIETEANSAKFLEKTDNTKVIKPRCLLVFGRSNNWNSEQKKAFRILNASYNQITIMTYDHILSRAKNILNPSNNE